MEVLSDLIKDSVSAFAPGGGGGITKGTAVIDFGSFPGSNQASVNITGQGSILSSNVANAKIRQEATLDHTINDHNYIALFTNITCSQPSDGVGFTINVTSEYQLIGTFNLDWQ